MVDMKFTSVHRVKCGSKKSQLLTLGVRNVQHDVIVSLWSDHRQCSVDRGAALIKLST